MDTKCPQQVYLAFEILQLFILKNTANEGGASSFYSFYEEIYDKQNAIFFKLPQQNFL
jgi:hypothetical protein